MHSEGYCSLSVCLSVYTYSPTTDNEVAYKIPTASSARKINGNFAKTTAFEIEKPAEGLHFSAL